MKGKLKIILPVLLLLAGGGGGAYFFLLSGGSAKKPPPPKITGTLFSLAPDFTVNLAGGHYGKVSVALQLTGGAPASADPSVPAKLDEDAAVRSIVTDDLTGLSTDQLITQTDRHKLLGKILKDLESQTDVEVTRVYFTDVVVQ
jgi:flagellar FliL protein